MVDSSPSGGAAGPHGRPTDSTTDDLLGRLYRFGASELARCCALALRASELCGGRRCRIELTGTGSDGATSPRPPGLDAAWHRVPVRGPNPSGTIEAWLAVESPEEERTRSIPAELESLVACAGLVFERHRLAREARRARRAGEEIRFTMGHALRGHLNSALMRADILLLKSRDEAADIARVREDLEEISRTVQEMVKEIHEFLETPDSEEEGLARAAAGREESVRIPGLLRFAAAAADAGGSPPRLEIMDEVPAVRADRRRLELALGEFFDPARWSRDTPTLIVRPDDFPAGSSGVRVTLSVDLPPSPAREGGPGDPEADAGRPETSTTAERSAYGGAGEVRPSLRELLDELRGQLRIEAGEGGRVDVIMVFPAGEHEESTWHS